MNANFDTFRNRSYLRSGNNTHINVKPRTAYYSFFKKHLLASLRSTGSLDYSYHQRACKSFQFYPDRRAGRPLNVVAHAFFRSGKIIERRSIQRSGFFRALSRCLTCSDNTTLFTWLSRRGFHRLSVRTQLRVLSSAFPFLTFPSRTSLLANYYDHVNRVNLAGGRSIELRTELNQITTSSPKMFLDTKLVPFSNFRALSRTSSPLRISSQPTRFLSPVAEVLRRRYSTFTFSIQATTAPYYSFMGSRLSELANYLPTLYPSFPIQLLAYWARFANSYTAFFLLPHVELFTRRKGIDPKPSLYSLRFRFNKHRFVITLSDTSSNTTYFFISTGLFSKFFQHRKSLRKNKATKILMVRFLRKVLLILNISQLQFVSSGIPLFLDKLLSTLYRQLPHPFTNPFTGSVIDESTAQNFNLNISKLFFHKSRPFGSLPTKKRGRVKRKIRRKLVRAGGLID